MRKRYRNKKSSGCALCKPWKHGWERRIKNHELAQLNDFEKIKKMIINM